MGRQYIGTRIYEREAYRDLRELLSNTCQKRGNATAYIYRNRPRTPEIHKTYDELMSDINALGTALCHRRWVEVTQDQESRTHIGIIGPNSYPWVVAHNAVVFGAGISVPMDRQLADGEIINLCRRGEVRVLCIDYKLIAAAQKIAESIPEIVAFIIFNSPENLLENNAIKSDGRFYRFEDILLEGRRALSVGDDTFIRCELDPEAMQIISFTSGTTSLAKGVILSHRAIVNDVRMTLETVAVNADDRSLSLLPLHHIFESSLGMYAMWHVGGCICICDGLRYIQQNLQEWRISVMLAVPLLMENLHRQIMSKVRQQKGERKLRVTMSIFKFLARCGLDLRRRVFAKFHSALGGALRYIFVGASALSPEINQFFLDLGIKCYMGYGLTETAPLICGCNDRIHVPGTVGRPLPGVTIEIRDINNDQTLPQGETGEIVVNTPSLMNGYYRDAEATDRVIDEKRFFYTGDVGYFDARECLRITGRSKSMIVLTNGKKVFPEEIEFLLNTYPFIKQSLVFGEENQRGNIDVCALLQVDLEALPPDLADRNRIFRAAIKEVNEQMPVYKKIRFFVWQTRDMITTTTLKIKRQPELAAMRDLLLERHTTVEDSDGKQIDA